MKYSKCESDKYKKNNEKRKTNRAHQTKYRLSTQISIRWTVLNLNQLSSTTSTEVHEQYLSNKNP
jgi:hypothetical protein